MLRVANSAPASKKKRRGKEINFLVGAGGVFRQNKIFAYPKQDFGARQKKQPTSRSQNF
jgi:hypothetical protein